MTTPLTKGNTTMNIIGPDALVFGVDDLAACRQYLTDYGLKEVAEGHFEALDGTAVEIRAKDDASLPPAMETASMLRETVYGVADVATLDAIEAELKTDRPVTRQDGVVRALDDMGFALAFQVTVRRALNLPSEAVNAPGAAPQRGANVVAVNQEAAALPRSLSHVVYFVPDSAKAEAFYARLGFVCTDYSLAIWSIKPLIDKNGDGFITNLELKSFLQNLGFKLTEGKEEEEVSPTIVERG